MLISLRIRQLGLVDELAMDVPPGLTVLTGETGAGKSMIAGAIALLTGEPVPKDLVRGGEDLAWVEGLFDLGGHDLLRADLARAGVEPGEDDLLLLRREIRREGRNRVLINGRLSSLPLLQEIGPRLLSVQSQDQQRELRRPAFVRDLLDELAGAADARAETATAHTAWTKAQEALAVRRREAEAHREQIEMWTYQRDELRAAALDPEEEPGLDEALALKRHAVELRENAAAALEALSGGEGDLRSALGRALRALTRIEGKSARLDEGLSLLREAEAAAGEAESAVERFLDAAELDPGDLDALEERKALYAEIRRKYRRDVPDLLNYLGLLEERIARQESTAGDLAELEARRDEAADRLLAAAAALRRVRHEGAGGVSRLAEDLIRPLALPDLELSFSIAARRDADAALILDGEPCDVRRDGADEVDLLVRTNRGERAGRVSEIASGGETSRIHLGLTALRGDAVDPPLQLFDEIDAGLGMDKARPVAALLRRLAAGGQVVCITHLAPMAVHGETHWRARKEVVDGRTLLRVESLAGNARVDEVARLLGEGADEPTPDDGDARRLYARDLLDEAKSGVAAVSHRSDLGNGG